MHYNKARLAGDIQKLTDDGRFWENVEPTGFCWLWTGNVNDAGYGRFGAGGKIHRAHRFAYELLVGPIPEGCTLDHLCRMTLCVNPDHLDPVGHVENTLRGFGPFAQNKRKTTCPKGHEYTDENTYLSRKNMRQCRRCGAENARRYRASKKAGIA
jgi:hypothetical protein